MKKLISVMLILAAVLALMVPVFAAGAETNDDVTGLYKMAREGGYSFYFALVYAASKAAAGIKNFHYRIVNEEPYYVETVTPTAVHLKPGEDLFVMAECDLYDDMKTGRFPEPTFGEHIDEEELFLQELDVENCLYFGLHPSNVVRMQGWLPRDKEAMLYEVSRTRSLLSKRLNERPVRYGEGAILL